MTEPEPSPSTTVFAIVTGRRHAQGMLEVICKELTTHTSLEITAQLCPSYDDLAERFANGTAHIAWISPLVALDLESRGLVRIAACSIRGGGTSYHSALFAKRGFGVKGSSNKSLSGLQGRRVGWVNRNSAAGYLVPRMHLKAVGLDPDALFSEQYFLNTHEAVVSAVLSEKADVGATFISLSPIDRRVTSAGWMGGDDGVAQQVEVICKIGPIPSEAVVVSSRLPDHDVKAIASALRGIGGMAWEAVRELFRADGFDAVVSEHYAPLRRLLGSSKT